MLFDCHMTDEIVDLFTLVLSTSAHVKTKPLPHKQGLICALSPQVLTRYLQEIEDLEVRLQLATEAEMFDIGIDVSLSWHGNRG